MEIDAVDSLVSQIFRNISRRKAELDDDNNRVAISNRFLSSELSKVPGVEQFLNHQRQIKQSYGRQDIADEWSHGTVSRAELHQRYTGKDKCARKDMPTCG